MAINRDELKQEIRKMINESVRTDLREAYDGTTKFNIHRYVNGLIEEGQKNPQLMSFLLKYDKALNEGAKDFMLFEKFGNGLARFAKANPTIKGVIKQMNETLATDGNALNGYMLIESIGDPYIKDEVLAAFNEYQQEKNAETRDNLVEALEPLTMVSDPVAMQMHLLITEDSSMHPNFINTQFINESEQTHLSKKLQEAREQRQADDIFAKVEKYLDTRLDEEEKLKLTEKEEYCLNGIANKNGLNLSEEINSIAHTDAGKNEKLMEVLSAYQNAINQGAYEERLYETLLSNISRFNYLKPVDKAIKSIHEKVDNKLEEITLTKLLEMMKDDNQAFIYVDLIQEDVARYVKDPNPTNRVQLRNALMPYASDPLINEMFNVLYADNTRRSNELSEKALNIKDQINIIRENATVSNIYSPVQYIKENECVFNVRGQYYVKKGNNIAILDDKYVDQLNEKFTELCHLVNDPHVEINEDYIILNGNDKYATIYEGYVDICGHKESKDSLRNLREMCMKYEDYDTNFYIMCSCLLENFNNIAKIDWAKHVTLNENNNINVDLFKLDQNIFMTTHNDSLGQNTFYRNINPIYCKTKMNEHMGINVSSLFSDLLPNQDKIILKLNETKNSYEDSISQYEEMIDKLKEALSNASEENKSKLEDAISDAEEKLDDLKAEYKEWQDEADAATGNDSNSDSEEGEGEEDGTRTEQSNEPLSDDEVEGAKDELSTPLSDTTDGEGESTPTDSFSDEENDEGAGITDDEFAEFIGNDDEDEISDEVEDDSDDVDIDTEAAEDNSAEDIISDEVEDDSDDDAIDAEAEDDIFADEEGDGTEEPDQEEFAEVDLGDEGAEDTEAEDDEDIFEPEGDEATDDFTTEEGDEDDSTDIFGGDTEDPLGNNEDNDIPTDAAQVDMPSEEDDLANEVPTENAANNTTYKIADVMFDENVKDGTKSKSGTVIVVVPMIDGEGKKYIENQTIDFYLNDDNTPILNNEAMSTELYNAVVNAIKSNEDYENVCQNGQPAANTESLTKVVEPTEVDDADYVEDENPSYYTDDERADADVPAEAEIDVPTEEPTEVDDDIEDILNTPVESEESEEDNAPVIMAPKAPEKEINDPVLTYTDGDTEYELPSEDVDDTFIPESKEVKAKKALRESIKITPVFKKGSRFFVNESTIKDSKTKVKEVAPLTEEIIDGSDMTQISEPAIDNEPIEDYDANNDINTLFKMHLQAVKSAANANEDDIPIIVDDINEETENGTLLQYFTITNTSNDSEGYTIYQIDNNIYYRDSAEFFQILEDINDNISDGIHALTVEYSDVTEDLISYPIDDVEDCLFIVSSIFSSIAGDSYETTSIAESCKIKKHNKLQTDYDDEKSVKYDEAKNGTTSENNFKQEVEDKQKKDGTVGALDQQQQEAYNPKFPNVNILAEAKAGNIIYEVNDRVLVNGEPAFITNVTEDEKGKQHLTVLKSGQVMQLEPSQVKPDIANLKDLEDVEPKDQTDLGLTQSKTDKMNDLNGKTVECNIIVDGYKFNLKPFKASLKDIAEGLDLINVTNDEDRMDKYPISNLEFDEENWPYAIIANEEDEPLRKIKVNPNSFINAKEDNDLVDCLVGDKLTQLPKRVIRIIA